MKMKKILKIIVAVLLAFVVFKILMVLLAVTLGIVKYLILAVLAILIYLFINEKF